MLIIALMIFSAMLCLACAFNNGFVNNTAFADGTPTVEMIEGASVRLVTETKGLRFSALVSKTCFDENTNQLKSGYSAGMLIIDTDSYNASVELTQESKTGAYANKVLDIAANKWDTNSAYATETQNVFNAVITAIPNNAYGCGKSLTARSYVYDGTNYIYSENIVSRCVAQVASGALSQGFEDVDGILTGFVDAVGGSFSVDGKEDATIDVTLKLGESIAPVATPSYLAVALSSSNESVLSVTDGKISAVGKSDEPIVVQASLGSLTKTINVTIDSSAVDAQLAGAVYTSVDGKFGRVQAGYTYDTSSLAGDSTVGLHVKADDWKATPEGSSVAEVSYTYLKTNINLKANVTYTLRYKVKHIAQTGGPEFKYNVLVGHTDNSSSNRKDLSTAQEGYVLNNVYSCHQVITPTAAINGMVLVIVIAPNDFTNIEFTVFDIEVMKDAEYISSATSTMSFDVYADDNLQPVFEVKGGSDVANSSKVDIATGVDLTANTEYILTFKFDFIDAQASGATNIHWGLNYRTNADDYSANTQFKDASNMGEAGANSITGSNWTGKQATLTFIITPTADVENLTFRTLIHGTFFTSFEFEISHITVVARSALSNDLLGGVRTSQSVATTAVTASTAAYYVTDKDLLVTDNAYGIMFDMKAHDSATTGHVRYSLNVGMTAGQTYDITFKVVDINVYKSNGNMWWLAFGLQGEKLGGNSDQVALQQYKNNGCLTTEKIGDIYVYTITIKNYTALKTVENAEFNIYAPTTAEAQKAILTGVSITQSVAE